MTVPALYLLNPHCVLQFAPWLGACRLYAWKHGTLGLLESYPAGISKSQSPITAAFTIVALTLPIKL